MEVSNIAQELRESAKATFYDPLKSELNRAADHIDEIKAKNKKLENKMWAIIETCDHGRRRSLVFCANEEEYCTCKMAFDAIEYDWNHVCDY